MDIGKFVLASINPPSIFSFFHTMDDANGAMQRARNTHGLDYQPMTFEQFLASKRAYLRRGELNERGNYIYRDEGADEKLGIHKGASRYYYDFKALKGWAQYDTHQDAYYFGVWVNVERCMTFTYAEGDRSLVVCPDREHLKAELRSMAEFYGDPPPAFVCLSQNADGSFTRTDVYDTRPTGATE